MSIRSEQLIDAKLIMRDGLARIAPNIPIDRNGYVDDWCSNLLPGVSSTMIEDDFRRGKGSELDTKFRAAHSSAALVVNTFSAFRARQESFPLPGLGLLNLVQFEKTFPTALGNRIPPHLDAMALGTDGIVAIESKCLEYLVPKAAQFAPAYQTLDECRRTPWFAEMERLRGFPRHYRHLDAAQLIKHAFGLINAAGDTATLLYVFWEPDDAQRHEVFRAHRAEVKYFAERVAGGGPAFKQISYPEVWTFWAQSKSETLREHAALLRARYGGSLGSYENYTRVDGRKTDEGTFNEH